MTSPDGITWAPRVAAEANSWYSVTYGNGLFAAVSIDGTNRIMTSPDGITWTPRAVPEENWWYSITYGNGLFVAVAGSGTNRVMTSPDGITWTARAAAEANMWYSITYGNGLFIASAISGMNRLMTSPDGITWTARAAAEANLYYSITYGNGVFIGVSPGGINRVMTSPDGITWTARAAAEANAWWSIAYGNGLFAAVSTDGANRVMTSREPVQPDLTSQNLTGTGSFTEGSTITFTGKILNTGLGDAEASVARFCVDNPSCLTTSDGEIGVPTVSALASGISSSQLSATWVATYGVHTLYFCADAGDPVSETDETNNCSTSTFIISRPNLKISNFANTGTLTTGNAVTFVGRVTNNGFATTQVPSTARICIDNPSCLTTATGMIRQFAIPTLTAGWSTTNLSTSWTATEGSHTVYFCADVTSVVTESNETDNCSSLSITVVTPPPDLLFYGSGNNVVRNEDDSLTVSQWVYNAGGTVNDGGYVDIQIDWDSDGGLLGDGYDESYNAYEYAGGGTIGIIEQDTYKSVSYTIPNPPSGNHRFRFEADTSNIVIEASEVNNTSGWFSTCPATTLNHCIIPESLPSEGTYGTCETGYSGVCSYTCSYADYETWELQENSCTPPASICEMIWTPQNAVGINGWRSIAYHEGTYVAVSEDGVAMYSNNGTEWFESIVPDANDWFAVTYGSDKFVAVARTGTNRVMTSPDGISWDVYPGFEGDWRTVTYGDSKFVALGYPGTNALMTSSNGIDWDRHDNPEPNWWNSVVYSGTKFVAVAATGDNRVMTSVDGISWNPVTVPGAGSWQSVTYGAGKFVAVAYGGTNRVMTSVDGDNWEVSPAPEGNMWYSLTFGDGTFVAVSIDGINRIMTSTNGIDWTLHGASELNSWRSIVYGDNKFVSVSYDGNNRIMTSPGCVLPAPVVDSFTVNGGASVEVNASDLVTLVWETTGADHCEALTPEGLSFDTTGGVDSSTAVQANSISGRLDTYILACSFEGGTPVTETVTVRSKETAPALTTTVNNGEVTVPVRMVPIDSRVNIEWDTRESDPTTCTLVGGGINRTLNAGENIGSELSSPVQGRTTFTLTCPSGTTVSVIDVIPKGWEI